MRTAAYATIAGLALGVALDVGTALMAASGPSGQGWSFRGNGALVVPLGFGAAVLAGGWVGLSSYAAGLSSWRAVGVITAAAASVPAVLSILLLVLFGSAAQTWSDLMTLLSVGALAASVVLAVALQIASRGERRASSRATALDGLLYAFGLAAGFFGAGTVLVPGGS